MRIRRVGPSNSRVSFGEIYKVVGDNIIDDIGSYMKPRINNPNFWEILDNKESNKMLTIEKTMLINGKKVGDMSVDDILKLIENEEQKIDRLIKIRVESAAITKLKDTHEENIKRLVEALESVS